jgi:type IV secretory pathway VirJ component
VQRVPQASWVAASPSAFEAAYTKLAVSQVAMAPPPSQLSDLPLVEEPVKGSGTRFVVLLSGDGGWAGIDKGLAAAFVAQNVPVVGLDSLRYFWKARTPEGLASDLDRLIRYYAARWQRSEVILIGYSQGADVLPFAVNRLPAATRSTIKLTALLGLAQKASFEFHFSNWLGPSGDRPILPEARRLSAADTLCVQGDREKDSLCPKLVPAHARVLVMKGDHHFGGDYARLARLIVEAVR